MRKIKFRAKTDVNIEEVEHVKIEHDGNWVFGTYLDGFIVDGVVEATDEYIALEFWCPIDIDTVGQYTGVKDKNGKEIYEGDIIEYKTVYEWDKKLIKRAEVVFENGMFSPVGVIMDLSRSKIIGNIYENPELLESEE